MQIKIIIKTQRLTLSSNKIVCGTNNFIECLFDFQSSDWTELEKWALFKDGQNTYEMYIQDNKCIIPAQCISDQGEVIMSVVGRNNGKNITATAEDKLLLISGRAFDNPDEERLTPTYLEEVLGKVRDESLKAAASETNAAQTRRKQQTVQRQHYSLKRTLRRAKRLLRLVKRRRLRVKPTAKLVKMLQEVMLMMQRQARA